MVGFLPWMGSWVRPPAPCRRRRGRRRVVQQARVDARGTELLGLAPAADADAVPHRREAPQAEQRVEQLAGRLGDDEVDARLEAVRGVQPLAEDEVAGREVQADAVLEARVGLVVEVDADVVGLERPPAARRRRRRRPGAAGRTWCLASASSASRCGVERPTKSGRGGSAVGGGQRTRRVVAVGDGQRQRAPDGHDLVGGRGDVRVEGDDAVEVRGVDVAQLPQAALEVLVHGRAVQAARAAARSGSRRCARAARAARRAG